MNKTIFHIDVNSAFLSWEAVYRCPNLVLVPPNYGLYENCSAAFIEILQDYSDMVEQYSIDEAFVDMSASCHLFGTPKDTAMEIKERIHKTLGFANGVDVSQVSKEPEADKGYGNSTTTPFDVTDVETADKVLLALCETVSTRLRADQVKVKVISVGIRYSNLSYVSHQKVLYNATNLTVEIYKAACELFRELWNGEPIRHLGVHTAKVSSKETYRQSSFFDETDYDKLSRLDETIDDIRNCFGMDAVKRAAFLGQAIDHMTVRCLPGIGK